MIIDGTPTVPSSWLPKAEAPPPPGGGSKFTIVNRRVDLDDLISEIRSNTGPTDHYLVHLEEVHWLGKKRLDQRLLTPMPVR